MKRAFSFLMTTVMALTLLAQLPPRADDAYWRDSIPATMRQSYIAYGEQYVGQPWTTLPYTVFAEFKTNGNRTNYEKLCFDKRRQLGALVMAEIVEGKGRFVPDIVNGLGSLCEETWWGLPAHYGTPVPQTDDQNVDLFNAETAGLVAWTVYMLRPQLDRFTPLLAQRIDREVERRILVPALKNDYWWKRAAMNWNPWICSNWLACVLICEHDSVRRQQAIGQIARCAQTFIDAYPDDGGCDEGPGYWDRAAASLFEVVRMLEVCGESQAVRGERLEKLRAMGSYVYKTYIGNDYCVNFADAHDNRMLQQVNVVYPFGLWIDDPVMRRFAAYIGQQKGVLTRPAVLYDQSGNFPALGRELLFLSHISDFMAERPEEPRLDDVWLPDLQVMTARRNGLFFAVKGGNNGESHNHNDVGHFLVYADDRPLIVDLGVGEYTSKTFSGSRYDIWTMQSDYHNLPQINGVSQHDGKEYAALVLSHTPGRLQLELAGAYPEEAAVKSWRRTVAVGRKGVNVTEDYELKDYRQPTRLILMTPVEPRLTKEGVVSLSDRVVNYNPHQLKAVVEDVSHLLDPLLQRVWGSKMYRVVFTVQSRSTKGSLTYTIK